jgi:hypothetical protein
VGPREEGLKPANRNHGNGSTTTWLRGAIKRKRAKEGGRQTDRAGGREGGRKGGREAPW